MHITFAHFCIHIFQFWQEINHQLYLFNISDLSMLGKYMIILISKLTFKLDF